MARAGRDINTGRKGYLQGVHSHSVDWVGTLLEKGASPLQFQHLRYRRQPVGSITLHCVLLDLSASMLRGQKLAWAKGCLLAMTVQFYRRRDRLAVIGFSGDQASVIQPVGGIATFNENWIAPLNGGGGTPIGSAVTLLDALLSQQKMRRGAASTHVWLMTDGRFADLPTKPELIATYHVIDFENDMIAMQRCRKIASIWGASWTPATEIFAASSDAHH